MRGKTAKRLRRLAKKVAELPEARTLYRPPVTVEQLKFRSEEDPKPQGFFQKIMYWIFRALSNPNRVVTGYFFRRNRSGERLAYHIMKREYKAGSQWVRKLVAKEKLKRDPNTIYYGDTRIKEPAG